MKHPSILMFCILLLPIKGLGQHELRANFGSLLYNHVGIDYEYLYNDEIGLRGSINFFGAWGFPLKGDDGVSGFSIVGEYRSYTDPTRRDNNNFYWAPYLKFKQSNYENGLLLDVKDPFTGLVIGQERIGRTENGLSVGLNFGFKYVANSNLVLDFWAGYGRYLFGVNTYDNGYDTQGSGLIIASGFNLFFANDFAGGISLGYRF